MVLPNEDSKPSPEIKKLVSKITPAHATATAQEKYDAILKRKCYDHHCFLECVLLRMDTHRGAETTSKIQQEADTTFTYMLSHAL